jgi:hypothetical protein
MNKLRELIKANSDAWDACDAWDSTGQDDNEKFDAYLKTCDELKDYFFLNKVEMADLIDSAGHLVRACSTGVVNASGEPMGVRVPSKVDVDQLREVLAKVENDK